MSDINDADDLLNCELLGELDEHALLGDEDDLLLSDEEVDKDESKRKSESKLTKSNDINKSKDKKHVDGKLLTKSSVVTKLKDKIKNKTDVAKINKKIEEQHAELNVSTSCTLADEKSKVELTKSNKCKDEMKSQNDEVSSTNKEIKSSEIALQIEKNYLPVSQESSNLDELNYEPDVRDEDSEENSGERLNIKQSSEREDLISSSPEKNQPNIRFPFVKRGRGRGGGPPFLPRTHMPNIRLPFNNRHTIGGDNSNPQQAIQHAQYPSNSLLPYSNGMQGKIPLTRQPYPPSNHMINPRMEFPHHRPLGPNFIPPNPNENIIGPRMYGQRHPPPNGIMPSYNGQQPGNMMRPMFRPSDPNQLRPRMQLRPQAPVPLGIQNNPNYMSQQVTQIPQPHLIQSNMGGSSHQNTPSNSSVLPRKVLINPNFKGGVEAATNQLMKDTQFIQTISSHVSHLQSDEELLRQQEEFIKKNQIQIDKRRFARSPGRSRSRSRSRSRGRIRSRERSYSPQRRRDFYRERRGGGFRGTGTRNRRANSREWDNDRKRRSFTPDRKDKDRNNEEEDEETRAYRLEIEKQKAMREKILKDKEMRRRKAAEDKLNEDKIEEPTKLKPIVVTQSKIISLKKVKEKNELESGTHNNNSKIQRNASTNTKKSPVIAATKLSNENKSPQRAIKRSIPTAKILPDAKRSLTEHIKKDIAVSTTSGCSGTIKSTAQSTTSSTTAIVKPVLKKSAIVQTEFSKNKQPEKLTHSDDILEDYDDELLEEDRLLASPTPSPSNTPELENDDDDDDDDEDDDDDNENNVHIKSDNKFNSDGDEDDENYDDDDEDFVNNELKNAKKTFMSSNRKVLLKPFHKNDNKIDTTKKRVFDRLEKPKLKVGVKESAKKRIQRIIE